MATTISKSCKITTFSQRYSYSLNPYPGESGLLPPSIHTTGFPLFCVITRVPCCVALCGGLAGGEGSGQWGHNGSMRPPGPGANGWRQPYHHSFANFHNYSLVVVRWCGCRALAGCSRWGRDCWVSGHRWRRLEYKLQKSVF